MLSNFYRNITNYMKMLCYGLGNYLAMVKANNHATSRLQPELWMNCVYKLQSKAVNP